MTRGDSRADRGTTLVELLVSIAVISMIMVFLASIVAAVSNQWTQGSSRLVTNAEAGVAMDYLVQDFRSIVMKGDGSEWLRIGPAVGSGSEPETWMLLLSRPADSRGQVATVSYRLSSRDPLGGIEIRPSLYRCVFSPQETIEKLGSDNLQIAWREREPEVAGEEWFLASNVVELRLVLRLQGPAGGEIVVDSAEGLRGRENLEAAGAASIPEGTTMKSASIELTLVDDVGMDLLRSGSLSRDEIVQRFGQQFVEEVRFPARISEGDYEI